MKKVFIVMVCILLLNCAPIKAMAFTYGDADRSDILTSNDVAMILQKVLNSEYELPIESSTYDYMEILDVDDNNILTSRDSAIVLQKVLDRAYKMPCEINDMSETTTEITTITTTETTNVTTTETTTETTTADSLNIEIRAGGRTFTATMYDNPSARAFLNQMPMTLNMSELNENEKYYFTDTSYPTNSQQVGRINAGDIMLYGDDCIVVFYESFNTSYSYTPLGHIDNPEGLAPALGNGSVKVSFTK